MRNVPSVEYGMQNRMIPVGRFKKSFQSDQLPELFLERPINWLPGSAPKDEPVCGFDNQKCANQANYKWPFVITLIFLLILIVLVFLFRLVFLFNCN